MAKVKNHSISSYKDKMSGASTGSGEKLGNANHWLQLRNNPSSSEWQRIESPYSSRQDRARLPRKIESNRHGCGEENRVVFAEFSIERRDKNAWDYWWCGCLPCVLLSCLPTMFVRVYILAPRPCTCYIYSILSSVVWDIHTLHIQYIIEYVIHNL